MGSRRSGFEHLRDIITRYRREWARAYLESYLRARWESDLREPARLYAQVMADKGRPPPPKQFARMAAIAINRWFGGNIDAFCASIGEKSPFHPTGVFLMPPDRIKFATQVFEALGGVQAERKNGFQPRVEPEAAQTERNIELQSLAEESLHFVQLQEALGRPPNLKEFGRFDYRSTVLAPDIEQAWNIYAAAISSVLEQGSGALNTKQSQHQITVEACGQQPQFQIGSLTVTDPAVPRKRSWLSRLWSR
jgi:hypothetical protein